MSLDSVEGSRGKADIVYIVCFFNKILLTSNSAEIVFSTCFSMTEK